VDIIIQLVLGAIAGVLAMFVIYRKLPDNPLGWIGAVLVGLLGGWLGGIVFNLLGLEAANWLGSLIVAFAGALAVLYLLRKMAPGQES
jgi:uncharacterized membrane protein YeaQ/YmgE (transglycosylase-associated protein family)